MLVGFRFLLDRDSVWIDEGCHADNEIHGIANQLVLNDLLLGLDDMVATAREILEGDVLFNAVAGAIETALAHTG